MFAHMQLSAGVSLLQLVERRLHFFMSCWPEAFFDLLPCGPLHRASHNMELPSSEGARERTRKSASKGVLTGESQPLSSNHGGDVPLPSLHSVH